jgi:hypothetical protein
VIEGAELTGRCHCGAVSITIPQKPSSVTQCNCTLCSMTGFRGIYFPSGELRISGEFDGYVRSDVSEPFLQNFRCKNCGIATHWEPLTPPPHGRMGVNANLFDPAIFEEAEITHVDGRSWPL